MKQSHQCPKCQSEEILIFPHGFDQRSYVSIGLLDYIGLARYVCMNCGYTEEWVESHHDLQRIRMKHNPLTNALNSRARSSTPEPPHSAPDNTADTPADNPADDPPRPAIGSQTDDHDFARHFAIREVIVNDTMQQGYTYLLTAPIGRNFDPRFRPELTPAEMLEMGVFGGKYMNDCQDEFPSAWFKNARLSPDYHDPTINFFGVRASTPLSYWQEKGWIRPQDPRGWFQWYCRYYMGRRSPDDERQIKRWRAMRRHIAQIRSNCRKGDLKCRPRQRQALLHWAYDSRRI